MVFGQLGQGPLEDQRLAVGQLEAHHGLHLAPGWVLETAAVIQLKYLSLRAG